MMNFIASSMRRMGIAPDNRVIPKSPQTGSPAAGASQAPLAHMTIGSKWSYSSLEYPKDIQSRSDMGHYMMFYVNVPVDSGYGRTDSQNKKGTFGNQGLKAKRSMKDPAQSAVMSGGAFSEKQRGTAPDETGSTWQPGSKNKVIERKAHQGTASDATKGKIKRTHRTNDAIVLYMPPQVQTNYTADYKETELGANIGEVAGRVSTADLSVKGIEELGKGLSGMIAHQAERAGGALLGTALRGDINAARDKLSNRAQNNFLEACFTGLQFRKFSFSWKFTAKSPEEAQQVRKIIQTFKFHMLPEMKGGDHGRWYGTPAEFDIFYMFRGDENNWINKIQTCVLRNMDVNYAPNGYQTFRPIEGDISGAPPIEIDMKLDFQETKLITKEDALKGF